jgi:hypothetical protein
VDDQDIWQPNDDMITDFFHPSKDDLSKYTYDDFQSYLGSCDAYPFEHSYLLYDEDFQSPSCSNFDGHKVVASLEQLETHTTKQQYFILGLLAGICR